MDIGAEMWMQGKDLVKPADQLELADAVRRIGTFTDVLTTVKTQVMVVVCFQP